MGEYLSTQSLSVGYQKLPLLRDINIRLRQGEILVLIGANGSGKSTILKSLTKYLAPLEGRVYVGQRDIGQMSNLEFARQTAIVFTERIKTELMTCEDVVATGRYPYTGRLGLLSKEDRKLVREAMELVRILDLQNRDFHQISDGQRQRVLLARAICQQPQMIVLDEPTSFLDVRYKLELLEILRTLAREKHLAVLLSLHELDLAQKIADSVLAVKGDRVFCYGKPEEIFRPEVIRELYDLDNGSYNPLFGSLEMQAVAGKAEVFVIAGGGTGIETYRRLQRERIPFATGVLHKNDIDYQVAKELAVTVISEESFDPISEAHFLQALEVMRQCPRVENCLQQYGVINERNRALLEQAQKWRKVWTTRD